MHRKNRDDDNLKMWGNKHYNDQKRKHDDFYGPSIDGNKGYPPKDVPSMEDVDFSKK